MHVSMKQFAEDKAVDTVSKITGFAVDPKALKFRKGFNRRNATPAVKAHIERLKMAMIAGANVPPIDVVVEDDEIIVIDGHCRTSAALLAIAEGTPVKLEARHFRGDIKAQHLHMLGTGSGSMPLSPLECGQEYLLLIKQMKMTEKEIADALGISTQTVKNGLLLAESPLDVQQALSTGKISATVARQAVKKHGSKAGAAVREAVAKSGGKKVKSKSVSKGAAQSFCDVAGKLRDHVNGDIEEAAALAAGKHVQVPAALLQELFRIYDGVKK